MPNDPADLDIRNIKGVGPHRTKLLARLGIRTAADALYYLPHRYEDRTGIKKIRELVCGKPETAYGKVVSADVVRLPGRTLRIFELVLDDGSALLKAKWFNQPFMKKVLKPGLELLLYGTVRRDTYGRAPFGMDNPEYEIIAGDEDSSIHMNRIVPVYRVTAGLSVRQMRTIMFDVLASCVEDVVDATPAEIVGSHALPALSESLREVHFPGPDADISLLNSGMSLFHRRLAFDEFFMLELGLAMIRKKLASGEGIAFRTEGNLLGRLIDGLPFRLTKAQKRVFTEIRQDMEKPHPMNRLIQGDVGCGKTVVALLAMVISVECGYQAALMAPTEILAEQHYLNILRYTEALGLRICLLTGSDKERPLDMVAAGEFDIVIGTHALIQEGVTFRKLGLAVIDEQHRFGVVQRSLLRKKSLNPDVLVMTATPIPRTLAMTLYGDLDCSVIDELPPDRHPVVTRLEHAKHKESLYALVREEVKKGRQVYVVYPIIEESEKTDLRSAELGKQAMQKFFPEFRIGLVHGRMSPRERERAMASFQRGETDILVSTTVIEVGVDVPNASLMIIIHAERFGLSQLHQLRGRIGRGPHRSFCILLAYEPYGEDAARRLRIMVESTDGFRIAEEDLEIRGSGELFGTRQSGMPDLKIAQIARDASLLDEAKREAFAVVERDAELAGYPLLKGSLSRSWKERRELFSTC